MKSYLERTMGLYKQQNFLVEKTEYFNLYGNVRHDLYGFIDAIAVHPYFGTIGLQSCGKDFASHIKKLTEDRKEQLLYWLTAGNRLHIVGWRELKNSGWCPRIQELTTSDLKGVSDEVLKYFCQKPVDIPDWLMRKA